MSNLIDEPGRYPRCPRCRSDDTWISYYGCDSDPYPFKGFGIDCWKCGLVFDSMSVSWDMKNIDFDQLRDANVTRCVEWMGDMPKIQDATFHACELGGEVGEALNVIKKFDRLAKQIPGSISYGDARDMLEEELADIVICVDILGAVFGIDLARAVQMKFNKTTDKHGFETRLVPKDG